MRRAPNLVPLSYRLRRAAYLAAGVGVASATLFVLGSPLGIAAGAGLCLVDFWGPHRRVKGYKENSKDISLYDPVLQDLASRNVNEFAQKAGMKKVPRIAQLTSVDVSKGQSFGNYLAIGGLSDRWILLQKYFRGTPDELRGVLAHETTHLKARDGFFAVLAGSVWSFSSGIALGGAATTALSSQFLSAGLCVGAFGALRLVGQAFLMKQSRNAEFNADRGSVLLTGSVIGLQSHLHNDAACDGPRKGALRTSIEKLFQDHPSNAKRVKRMHRVLSQENPKP